MVLAFFVISILVSGHVLSECLWRGERPLELGPAERIASSLATALLLWIGLNWLLSICHAIALGPLLVGALCLLGASFLLWRTFSLDLNPFRPMAEASEPIHASYRGVSKVLVTAFCVLLALWLAFVLWRGAIIPVATHDALSYHLPKSVLISRAQAYAYFATNDPRLSCQPPNFELLLSNFLIFQVGDAMTSGLSTLMYVFFIVLAMAFAERWWDGGLPAWGTGILAAGLPVALLHSGGHKNDLMMGVLVMSGVLWGVRWAVRGGLMPLLLAVLCLVASCGTKPQGGLFLFATFPMLFWGLARRYREGRRVFLRTLLVTFLACAAGFVLLGGLAYVTHATHTGTILGYRMKEVADTAFARPNYYSPNYGEWANYWMYPYLLFRVPFSANPGAVWVPWLNEYWFWPKYEIYMSHYGVLLTFLLPFVPAGVLVARRLKLERERAPERIAATLTFLFAVVLFLPIRYKILGAFNSFPRYLIFVPVLMALWSLGPLLRRVELAPARWTRRLAMGGLALFLTAFVWQGLDMAYNDAFLPLRYVLALKEDVRLRRRIYFNAERAASVVDTLAGPDDVIALDSGIDGWVYPAFGKDLTRPVHLLLNGPGPVTIPADAKWVVIDRGFNIIWERPDFRNMGQFWACINRGVPSEEDRRVATAMAADKAFRLVYSNWRYQFVYQRIQMTAHKLERQPG